MKGQMTGTAIKRLILQKIKESFVPVAPLDEQREIVAEIEKQFTRLEAGVAGLRRVQANLKRYRAAVLKAACEGKLVPTEAELARQEGRTYETGAQLLERILSERRQKLSGKGKYKEPVKPDAGSLRNCPRVGHGVLRTVCSSLSQAAPEGGHVTILMKVHFSSESVTSITGQFDLIWKMFNTLIPHTEQRERGRKSQEETSWFPLLRMLG